MQAYRLKCKVGQLRRLAVRSVTCLRADWTVPSRPDQVSVGGSLIVVECLFTNIPTLYMVGYILVSASHLSCHLLESGLEKTIPSPTLQSAY